MNLQSILGKLNIEKLTLLQEQSIKQASIADNLLILAPTGSGKTLSFLLPLAQQLKVNTGFIQSLIVVPSRELALQIEQVFKQMALGYKISCCYGGHSVRTEKNNLIEQPAVLIGTPGRLAFHLREGNIDLTKTSILVLDEFDKSLTLGFEDDMSLIVSEMQNLQKRYLTSATTINSFPNFLKMNDFKCINFLKDVNIQPDYTFKLVKSSPEDKIELLFRLICKLGNQKILIFCNHRDAVERVSEMLIDYDIIYDIYHGKREQDERERALVKFRNDSLKILIATDLAARGLDIPEIDAIIHYQLPVQKDAFVHRNGRTARMKSNGVIYLCSTNDEQIPYLDSAIEEEILEAEYNLPTDSEWQTLYMSLGKKNKVNKIDILGFMTKVGGLLAQDIGLIEVKDFCAYVAIKRKFALAIVQKLNLQKVKGQKVKVATSM